MAETPQPPRYDSTRQTWQAIWDSATITHELEAVRYPRSMATIRAYTSYLTPDQLIVEAGSGLSAVVITLRQMGYKVIGLDYAVNALHTSRQYDPTLPLLAGDVHHLPCADNSVGAYLSFGVLEHFEQGMGPALAEAYRVLEPGGILILTIPYPNVVHQLLAWWRELRGQSRLNNDDFYESTYTRRQLIHEVTAVGFRMCQLQPTSHDFTLWGLGGPFQGPGYYQTSPLAEKLGGLLARCLPWAFNFMTLVVARKPGA